MLIFYRGTLLDRRVLSLVVQHVQSWPMIWMIISTFEFALFIWSVKFIDIAVAAILYETWPVLLIFLTAWLFREEARYRRISLTTWLLVLLSMAGFSFALASQTADFGSLWDIFSDGSYVGAILAILSTIAWSLTAFSFRWGANLGREVTQSAGQRGTDYLSLELCFVVVGVFIVSLLAAAVSSGIGLARGELLNLSQTPVKTFIGGGFLLGLAAVGGSIAWRKANIYTTNLGINALAYATPVLSLIWLFSLGQANVTRVDYLVIGAAAIITANLLINFEAEIRWGFKALLLGLGTCGAVVYLRDGVFEFIGIDRWNWTAGGYFESIALAATIFILLLAFRVARLVARTSEEDTRTFSIYRKLDMLSRRGVIHHRVCELILEIDQARNDSAKEKAAYNEARQLLAAVDPQPLNEADSLLLSDAEANLDALARSKQVDIHFGEMFALSIFGTVTVGIALLSRPPLEEGWTRLLIDLFAMVISAVVIFLLVHIQDLQRERDDRKLEASDSGTEFRYYVARFYDTAQRSFDQRLSVIVGGAIILTYGALLAHKWLGWFG